MDFVMRKSMTLDKAGIDSNNEVRLTDLDYAHDIALLAQTDRSHHREAKIGLPISSEKSKVMKIGNTHAPININVGAVRQENVAKFIYLGSVIACGGDAEIDVRTRIAKAAAVFRKLQSIW
ncbi:hypothetical protein ANCDUO_13577 [Ancylostoma duodenale]|uniref:Reverse transcriptase domain-containing protein n=1 Tax=Ancylostoma duodenale TaxID=51022 RepID=A0A0C2G5I0_9BILA|nr:hypothetical protein ANCDUO_13577 [Ancylostoma duodenale]